MATAIEQLVKCVLARINPLFIADERGKFDTQLHLAGLGHRASNPATAIRTIAVSEALVRVRRVLDPYQEPATEVQVLLDARNAAVHLGAATQTAADVLLAESARYIELLLDHAGTTRAEYWGDLEEIVEAHTARRLTEIEGALERRLQLARDRFAEFSARLEEVEIEGLRRAVEPTGPAPDFDAFPAECPACGSMGVVRGDPIPDWEADYDVADGEGYVSGVYVDSITLERPSFDCRVCGLSLYGALLDLTPAIETTFKHDDDFNPEDASTYFNRQLYDDDY